jgi:hypothetical protein
VSTRTLESKRGRLIGSLAVVALVAGACASPTAPLGSGPAKDEGMAAPATSKPGTAPEPDGSKTGTLAATSGGSPKGSMTVGAAQPPSKQAAKNWAPLFVELNGTCFDRGDTIEAHARSVPKADFAFTVAYTQPEEGDRLPPDFVYLDGEANPSGEVTWSVVVRPTVEYGPAVFKTVVKTPEGKGAFDSKDLEISKDCA